MRLLRRVIAAALLVVLIVGAEDAADKTVVEQAIEALRASGEFDTRVDAMQLEAKPH